MTNEIKEILDIIKKVSKAEVNSYNGLIETPPMKWAILLDYITNLQKENMKYDQCLTELTDNYKDLQKELTNLQEERDNLKTALDESTEIVGEYKEENDRLNTNLDELQNAIDNIAEIVCVSEGMCAEDVYDKIKDYKSRIDKAIEYINQNKHLSMFADCREPEEDWNYDLEIDPRELLNILQGDK